MEKKDWILMKLSIKRREFEEKESAIASSNRALAKEYARKAGYYDDYCTGNNICFPDYEGSGKRQA